MAFIIPYIFQAGQKAIAEEVNSNFEYLKQSLEGVNSALEGKINSAKDFLNEDIASLKTQSEATAELLNNRETIIRLGTINAPDALEDGSIPTAQFSIEADRISTAAIAANAALSMPKLNDNTKYVTCMLEFTLAQDKTLTLPDSVKFSFDFEPVYNDNGVTKHRFMFDTTDGGNSWMCYFSKDSE